MPDKKLIISSKKFRGDSSVVSVKLPDDMVKKLHTIATFEEPGEYNYKEII